ncbi:MAG: FAD:protein FMN transferase [Lachnospiraceae bacterium]|nr:FAD:protein FMN transferase [Lachnospiraceae bacterium]MDY6222415.1 FAD:protein FMN transferase [Candidatus Alectryocaccobium sp.]
MKKTIYIILTAAFVFSGCVFSGCTSDSSAARSDTSSYSKTISDSDSYTLKKDNEESNLQFYAMDTLMDFTVYGDSTLLENARSTITKLESELSVTDKDSLIYTINNTGSGVLNGDSNELIKNTLDMCSETDGALDISIYPVVKEWGFTTGDYKVPDEETISKLLTLVDYSKIEYDESTGDVSLPKGMEIDLGSVAKGFAGQKVAEQLREEGVSSALLSLGGNVQTIGCKPDGSPWKIAIKNANGDSPMIVLYIEDKAVVTSGTYERFFEESGKKYWHIMDPATGHPADTGLVSVTVIGDDGFKCDALSTSLFVMGLEKASRFWASHDDFEAVFMTDSDEIYITEGLKDRFALTKEYADMQVAVIER